MALSYLQKEKQKRIKSFTPSSKVSHNLVEFDFLKVDCDNLPQLKLEIEAIKFTKNNEACIFAHIFNLLIKISSPPGFGSIIDRLFHEYNIFSSKPSKYDGLDLEMPASYPTVQNMKIFLTQMKANVYLYDYFDFSQEVKDFWIKEVLPLPGYDKYFNPQKGVFTEESRCYIKNLDSLLEKATLGQTLASTGVDTSDNEANKKIKSLKI